MKLLRPSALAALLLACTAHAFLSEDQLAAIAAGDKPDRTQVYIHNMRTMYSGAQQVGMDRSSWTVTADSQQSGDPATNAIDSDVNTFWETEETPVMTQFPHQITIDMQQNYWVQGVTYLPRQDGQLNGTIGRHIISLSTDGTNFVTKAFGLWHDDSLVKVANFSTTQARYLRLQSLSESGNRGPYTTAADINIFAAPSYTAPNPGQVGAYGPTIGFPTVLVAATVLHGSGSVMGWSSYLWDQFSPVAPHGTTWTTMYDASTQTVSEAIIQSTSHDMFCPGLSRDSLGRPIVAGGNNAQKVSVWDDNSQMWSSLPTMITPRGYQGQTTLSDGRIFTIGGSFSGGQFLKNGEVFSFATNAWTTLPGCQVQPMLTNDSAGLYRSDNHAWLFAWRNGSVLQAGPSKNMNWYIPSGNGSVSPAGRRGTDNDAMNGNAVLYDAVRGLMLTVGGSPNYDNSTATSNANILTIGNVGQNVTVTPINNMNFPRAFANSVALPNGQVFIVGGQQVAVVFTDTNAVMTPELFDPNTHAFTQLAPIATIRNYHSVALLLPDASILIGGGGLCGNCSTNKFDAQIYYPPYFYNSNGGPSNRPVINSMSGSGTYAVGAQITLQTNMAITRFAAMRYGSATHALDTDQRRVPIEVVPSSSNTYTITIPNDTGIMIPGAWMLFAVLNGVPSVSKTIMITN